MPRLKRWESPRREGRNDKGKGGSARKKQWLKRQQSLRHKLKDTHNKNNQQGGNSISPLFTYCLLKKSVQGSLNLNHFRFALASLTARKKGTIVKGILIVKMTLVTTCPNSGVPEVNSKIEPTQAIAAKHESNSNTPLFGVMYISFSEY